jgi:hypothetical protein
MSVIRRSVAILVALGSLLTLSACGSPSPSASAAYQATFIGTNGHKASYPLVLASDGHFVLDLGPGGAPFKGSWTESNNDVTLTGTEGATTKVQLLAEQVGTALRKGEFESSGLRKAEPFLLPWSAVRV